MTRLLARTTTGVGKAAYIPDCPRSVQAGRPKGFTAEGAAKRRSLRSRRSGLRPLATLVQLQAAEPVEQAARRALELQRQGAVLGVHAGDPAFDRIVRAVLLALGDRDLDPGIL